MSDPGFSAYLLVSVLALAGAAMSPLDRWAFRADAGMSRKLLAYAFTILSLWALAAAAVRIYGWPRLLTSPEPTTLWLPAPGIIAPFLVLVLAAIFLAAFLPLVHSLRGLRWRRACQAAIHRAFVKTPGFVPGNAAERAIWVVLSLTAGICEEILFRGFLIRLLHEGALALPVAGALALSCLCFGLGHFYQGLKGIVSTAIAGLGFGLLFLLSGSLLPCIALHALMDLQMVYVMRPIPGETPATATA